MHTTSPDPSYDVERARVRDLHIQRREAVQALQEREHHGVRFDLPADAPPLQRLSAAELKGLVAYLDNEVVQAEIALSKARRRRVQAVEAEAPKRAAALQGPLAEVQVRLFNLGLELVKTIEEERRIRGDAQGSIAYPDGQLEIARLNLLGWLGRQGGDHA